SCHALEFAAGHFAGIADDAALGAAEGDVYDSAFPGHPGGEGANFIDGDVRGKADAALTWAPNRGMEHPVTGENLELTVVHANRNVKGDFLVWIFQITINALLEAKFVGGDFKTRLGVLINIH